MTGIDAYLADQKRLAEAADEGPWFHHETVHADNYVTAGGGILTGTHVCGPTYEKANAAFISAARESVPHLVAALEAVVALAEQHRSIEQHNEMVPITNISALIREPSSAEYLAAIEAALGGEDDA